MADVLVQYGRPIDTVTKEGLHWLREELLNTKHVEKLKLLGLKEDRKPVIAGGLAILIGIFDYFQIETLHVTKGALRHGLLLSLIHIFHLLNVSPIYALG